MATYSSTLAWRIPLTEEPGELQSRVSQRVGRDFLPLNNISHSLNPQYLVTTILLSVFMSSAFLGCILRCYHTYHLSFPIRRTALSMTPEDPHGCKDQDFLSHSTSRVCVFFSMSSLTHTSCCLHNSHSNRYELISHCGCFL